MALRVKIKPEKVPDRFQPLSVHKLSVTRASRQVLREISFELAHGEILGIISDTGGGKSTLVETIAGIIDVAPGSIEYHHALHNGKELMVLSPSERYHNGIHCVCENRQLFRDLTVKENLVVAMSSHGRKEINSRIKDIVELFPGIGDLLHQKAVDLTVGQQQIVAIARAIMFFPSVLVLDEPTRSLDPKAIDALHQVLTVLMTGAIGVMICERHGRFIESIADRTLLLENGKLAEPITTSSRASEWKPQ